VAERRRLLRRAPPLREALESFVERRYRGGADRLRAVNEWQRLLRERTEPLVRPGETPGPFDDGRSVSEVVTYSVPIESGRLLYAIVRSFAPERGIELGTNVGVSAGYIASAMAVNGSGRLWTLEASAPRLRVAAEVIASLGLDDRVEMVPGRFEDTLEATLAAHGPMQFAFVDGNHRADATHEYFERLHGDRVVLVFDDIRWSDGMRDAWASIESSPKVAAALDLGRLGVIVCR
jgi:predicted O-methyltransferase YrrM